MILIISQNSILAGTLEKTSELGAYIAPIKLIAPKLANDFLSDKVNLIDIDLIINDNEPQVQNIPPVLASLIILKNIDTQTASRYTQKTTSPIAIDLLIDQIYRLLQCAEDLKSLILIDGLIFDKKKLFLHLANQPNGEKIPLANKEALILEYLHKHGTTTKTELLQKVWGYNCEIETKTLETHIHRINGKGFSLLNREIVAINNNYISLL